MRIILLLVAIAFLAGCEATAVNSAAAIKTKLKLNESVSSPVQLPVAYYVDKSGYDKKINFYGKMEEAAQLVSEEMFVSAEKLSTTSNFGYLLKIKTNSDWDYVWGGWENDIELTIVDRTGSVLMTKKVMKKASGTGGLYDFNAVYNAFAAALKDLTIEFLNSNSSRVIADATAYQAQQGFATSVSIKDLFGKLEPTGTGSGFFVNNEGHAVTAAHVVQNCIFVELHHKGQTYSAQIEHASQLLDLAIVKVDYANAVSALIEASPSISLGKQVFVTGYPLSGILAEYPSLTVGNISSRGGLKGAKGYFQFSAPIQPGNSGGAISDYKGNLMGVVSSTLNQAMMLQKSGTTSQNVNFGIDAELLQRFLKKYDIAYNQGSADDNFEKSSANAVEYSNQILCYQ